MDPLPGLLIPMSEERESMRRERKRGREDEKKGGRGEAQRER